MASHFKTGDTWPPLRGIASDANGLAPLEDAESIRMIAVDGVNVIGADGTAEIIDPPDDDGYNWRYIWAEGDTDVAGDYQVELEVTWDSGATPPSIDTYPKNGYETLTIHPDLD